MTTRSPAWRVLAVASCAALGWGVWQAGARALPEADAARWQLRGASVPLEVPYSSGQLRPDPAALDLWAYRGASPRLSPFADGTLDLVAHVPDDGQLIVRLGAETVTGPQQPVRAPGEDPGANPGANPGGPLPPRPTAGASAPPPRPPEQGVALIVDRSARAALYGRNLQCDPAAAPPATFSLHVDARGGSLAVSIDGKPVTHCTGRWGPGAVVFGAGVRRVQVDAVTVTPAGAAPFVDDFGGPLRSPIAGFLAALLAGIAATFATRPLRVRAAAPAHPPGAAPPPTSPPAPPAAQSGSTTSGAPGAAPLSSPLAAALTGRGALALAPLLALPLLGTADLRAVLDTLRLLQVPEALGPLLFAGLPAAVLLTLVAGGTAASPRRAALLGAVPFGGMLVASAVTRFPHDAPGWLVLAGLGAPLAVLAWINTHPYRRRVAASYALCAVLALCAEGGVRLTALDSSWTRTPGWKRASEEFAELLELRRYRTYPDEGFPVRPPDPDPTHRRIVALGGSSTGGAWQMDDLAQFWPARLGEQLAGTDWEVVNQGVGGWNTLHMRLYVESQVDRLDADILVIYVGHNDILATAPVPYRELYARYQQGASALKGVVDALNGVRLYVGLKHALLAMRDREGAIAVPVADARDNLTAIITAAHAHHARVLLVSEGLNPDPLPMRPYAAMERELAASTDSLFLDGADALWRDGDPDLFLDDCHLSVAGHTKLATWVRDTLTTAGWLGTSGGP